MFKKNNFKRNVVAVAICFAVSVLLSGCDDGWLQQIADLASQHRLNVTLVNSSSQETHLYMSWEQPGPENKLEPGKSRVATNYWKTGAPETVTVNAFRNGSLLGSKAFKVDWVETGEGVLNTYVTNMTVSYPW
jgi:hypothetical protein